MSNTKQQLIFLNNSRKDCSIELTKNSTSNEIKSYFSWILRLKESGNEFPVDLDEVWHLVYTRKQKAIDILKSDFIEGDDFYLTQMGKVVNSSKIKNGVKIDAFLSVSCLEYFIARKVRSVFEVYRQVFHKVVEQKTHTTIEDIINTISQKSHHIVRLAEERYSKEAGAGCCNYNIIPKGWSEALSPEDNIGSFIAKVSNIVANACCYKYACMKHENELNKLKRELQLFAFSL